MCIKHDHGVGKLKKDIAKRIKLTLKYYHYPLLLSIPFRYIF